MAVNSNQKGKRGEREFRDFLRERGYTARRTQQYCGNTEEDASDVICTELSHLHFEVKRTEKLNVYTAIKQAIRDCNGTKMPVVAHRRSHEDWLVIMKAEDFMDLVERNEK